jgi:RimJ/RimL family protein N-acetyltransferase
MTTAITLRDLTINDAENLFNATNNDWTIHHELLGWYCDTIDKSREIIQKHLSNQQISPYVICDTKNDFIGMIIVFKKEQKEIEISSFISKQYRGKGYGTQALMQIFTNYQGYKIWFQIDRNNSSSMAVMRKIQAIKYDEYMYYVLN